MRVTTKAEFVWSPRQERYILLRDKSIIWKGETAFCKGASAEQNDLANSQSQFYKTLQNDTNTSFGNQQNVLNSLNNSLNPIISAGPNQYGFNAAQTNNLNSSVINGTATQYANAARALGAQQGARGGGNSLLPSGVDSQQQARLAAAAADQTATGLTGVQQAGYDAGTRKYDSAVNSLGGVAGQYGSGATSFAGSANNAGSDAGKSWDTITQENNAASPWNMVGGILGGAASAFAGGLTGGLSSSLGGMFKSGAKGTDEVSQGWGSNS